MWRIKINPQRITTNVKNICGKFSPVENPYENFIKKFPGRIMIIGSSNVATTFATCTFRFILIVIS